MEIGTVLLELIAKERKSFRGTAIDLGVDRSSLYRSLKKGNPQWNTIERILDYLGYEIRIGKSRIGTRRLNRSKSEVLTFRNKTFTDQKRRALK
jgi:hypothetical protein